jgi:hypoxanthine phosphoribosyltransferase
LKKEIVIPQDRIHARVRELARQISRHYAGKEPILVGILNGSIFFFADLVRAMTIPLKIDFIRAASYGSRKHSSGKIIFSKDVELPLKDQSVVLVEDIVDTGLTLSQIVKRLWERRPASIQICALIDKLERRKKEVPIDYCGFQVEEGFLVGYGLDYDEQYRYLSDIYTLT